MKTNKRVKSAKKKTAGHSRRPKSGKIARLHGAVENPKLSKDELKQWYKVRKLPITLRLDADVLAWFKRKGSGYQTRINEALRKAMTGDR
jgi:uncharacterized protein (DUF4415 family)